MSRVNTLKPYLLPAILWLLAVGFLVVARQYDVQSRTVPLLIGRAMLALATLDVISRSPTRLGHAVLKWLNPAALAAQGPVDANRNGWKAVRYLVGIAAFVCGLVWLGMFVAAPAFLFVSLIGAGRSLPQAVVIAVAVSSLIWVLFSAVLHLTLFPGLLFGGQL